MEFFLNIAFSQFLKNYWIFIIQDLFLQKKYSLQINYLSLKFLPLPRLSENH